MYFFSHFTATDPMFLHWEYRKLLGQILWESVYNFAKSKGSDMMIFFQSDSTRLPNSTH